MAAAVVEFDGTPVEGRLQIANAKVQVVKGDIESALQLLRAIPSESAHYHAARKALADLYLEHRNDKRAYAACHEEVAAANPTVASYMMLGEAYMAVLEPEKAIAAFETALRKSPNDPVLASRIGHVLVSTHAYAKAIEYYSDAAAADPSKTPLRYELAALYLNLKRYDAAMTELKQLIAACGYSAGAVPDGGGRARMVIEDALLVTKALQLQAKVHKALNALPEALEALLDELDELYAHLKSQHSLQEYGCLQPMGAYRQGEGGRGLSRERAQQLLRALARHTARRSPPATSAHWAQTRDDMVALRERACLDLPPELPYIEWLQALLLTGQFRLANDYLRSYTEQLGLAAAEALVLDAAREYFNGASTTLDPALERMAECLRVLPQTFW
jgi:tetratricopeptide (TPR) repeat protein